MAKLYNLARMTTATTGTGTITLGSAVSSYVTFANAGVQNGETVTYAIVDGTNREVGRGVYTSSGTTLTRATILESTNANAAINLSGNAEVFITAAAEDITSSVEITGGSITGITDLAVADGGTGASDASGARTNLGLGTIATQAANNVSITGGSITGITDLAIADGGTGQSTASAAANALDGYFSIVSAAGTTTLTNTTARNIIVTGTSTQTIVLPDVTTLALGWSFTITNSSTGNVTLQSSGGNSFPTTINVGMIYRVMCIAVTGTTTASWSGNFIGASSRTGSGNQLVYASSPSLTSPSISTPTITYNNQTVTAGTNAQGQGQILSPTEIAFVTTTANNPSGVTLQTPSAGRRVTVFNLGTNPINVYPTSGHTINALAANASVQIPVGYALLFEGQSGTQWRTQNLGTSGQVLTSNGASSAPTWQTATASSMTLLGTITTTSGSSLNLTGLDLTTYKSLYISVNSVSSSSATDDLSITDGAGNSILIMTDSNNATHVFSAIILISLEGGGIMVSGQTDASTVYAAGTGNTGSGTAGAKTRFGRVNLTTASTSLGFSVQTGFDAGNITVYGVK